jgi:hypothetical protein
MVEAPGGFLEMIVGVTQRHRRVDQRGRSVAMGPKRQCFTVHEITYR